MADGTDTEYLTAADACALLGVKPATLYAYVSRGLVRSYKQGIRRQRLYRRTELEELLRVRADADEASGLPDAANWVGER
jgi:excisionase family DNA binding protein